MLFSWYSWFSWFWFQSGKISEFFLDVTAARKPTGILNSKLHLILLNMIWWFTAGKKNFLYIQFNFLQMLLFPNVRLSMTTFYINSAMNKYDEIKRLNFLRFISTQIMGSIFHSSFLTLEVSMHLFSFVCLKKIQDKIMS